jgi:hypothetical protein
MTGSYDILKLPVLPIVVGRQRDTAVAGNGDLARVKNELTRPGIVAPVGPKKRHDDRHIISMAQPGPRGQGSVDCRNVGEGPGGSSTISD